MSTYQLHQTARGLYRMAVVDAATKEVVWEQKEWGKNLILNNGMEAVTTRNWADCMYYGIAGTGIIPVSVSSAEVVASQAASTVTATVGSYTFAAGDIGNMIKWGTGEEARITGYTNPQTVTVTPAQSVASGAFVVWQTNQTGLSTEVKRTNVYLPGAPNCQTVVTVGSGVVALRRTFDFSAELVQRNYTEVGVSWSNVLNSSNTTFSRILLPIPVTVNVGQQLRFVYELQVTLAPIAPASFSAAVSGWPVAPSVNTNAVQQIQNHGLAIVQTTGNTYWDTGVITNEPSFSGSSAVIFISPEASAPATFNSYVNRGATGWDYAALSLAAYVPLSFTLDKTATFTVAQVNRSDLRSLGVGAQGGAFSWTANTQHGFIVVFDQAQAKTNTQTLTFTFRYTWGRTLA